MADQSRIQLPSVGDMTTAGDSFDSELAPILWKRTRLIFIVGLASSATAILFSLLYRPPPLESSLSPLQLPLMGIHPLSMAIGLWIVQRSEHTVRRVHDVAFLVMALNVVLILPTIAVFHPEREPFLFIGLMLFVTAAFLPCRQAQIWLAGATVVMSFVSQFVLPMWISELGAYWAAFGARTAFYEHLWRVVGVGLIAGVSVLVSRNLYRLQRTAHKAKRLGNYLIEKELGSGGMGKVFVARHALICRPTAVKVLSGPDSEGPLNIGRFEREVQLSASLTHPNTITIFDFGHTADNTFYYAMEYLEGLDLQSMVERFGPLAPERVIYFLRQVCGSLGEAHGRGIVHRDVKPSNIFITHRGGLYDFVKVLDFGLARKVKDAGDSGLTKTGMVFGTPRYIAPESVSGAQRSDARSDLYNLGGVAYWMLTGKPLFEASSSIDLIIDHVKTIPDPPSAVAEQPIPEALDRIIMKCLEKDPADRYQTADELLSDLQGVGLESMWSQQHARAWWEGHAPDLVAGARPISDGVAGDPPPAGKAAVTA